MRDTNGIPQQQLLQTRQRGALTARPLAHNVIPGTLYFDTTNSILYRSNGVSWETYSGGGSFTYQAAGGAYVFQTTAVNGIASEMMFAGVGTTTASQLWPTANLAVWMPMMVWMPVKIDQVFILNGSSVTGNVDVGIYNRSYSLLVSTGATAVAGTSAYQFIAVTETTLNEGLHYFAVSCSSSSNRMSMQVTLAAGLSSYYGILQEASAHPLPSTGTPVFAASDFLFHAGAVGSQMI
jgi:hypothetical protein